MSVSTESERIFEGVGWGVNAWEIEDNVEIITDFLQLLANKIKRDLTAGSDRICKRGKKYSGKKFFSSRKSPATGRRWLIFGARADKMCQLFVLQLPINLESAF